MMEAASIMQARPTSTSSTWLPILKTHIQLCKHGVSGQYQPPNHRNAVPSQSSGYKTLVLQSTQRRGELYTAGFQAVDTELPCVSVPTKMRYQTK